MSAIFISHSSKDSGLARAIEARLRDREYHSVFLDLDPEKGIVGGQSWERTLYRKLRACRAVIALCTDDYLRSHWCFAEIALARMEGKPVIGLLTDPLDASTTLPSILTERQLIDLRPGEDEAYARLWRALEQLDLTGVATNWNPKESPYLGLNAYQEEHAPVFFGREEEALAGIELLDRGAPPFLVVLGASGSGKSSLVRAGIVPRLRSRDDWLIVDPFRPGRDPWGEFTESLVRAFGRYAPDHLDEAGRRRQLRDAIRAGWSPSPRGTARDGAGNASEPALAEPGDERLRRLVDLLEALRDDPPPLTARVRNYLEWSLDDLRRLSSSPGAAPAVPPAADGSLLDAALDLRRLSQRRNARVLIVIDQFEELLGHQKTDDQVSGFLTLLRASIEAEHSPITVLCTMRSDFLGLFQHHPALQGIDFENLSLGPMRVDSMRSVITMPARLAAIEIEDGLVDRLIADTATPDALPLLSFTLWVMCRDRGEDERLEVAAYEKLGGLQGTITREADAVLAAAAREQKQDDLRRALLQMARLGDDGNYTRRPVDWDSVDIQRVHELLTTLVDRRVLVTRLDGDRRIIEVAHEALFRAWAPLKAWLENARSELLLRQQIEHDAMAWRDSGRTPDALWRGARLLQAHDVIGQDRAPAGNTDLSADFVRAGMRRRRRVRAASAAVVVAIMVVIAAFGTYALIQADRARKEQARTLDIARVAIAGEWMPRDPTSGALVLLEVADPVQTRFAARRLSEALTRPIVRLTLNQGAPVQSVALSPTGRLALTTSHRAAVVWDLQTARVVRTLPFPDGIIDAVFDPTGRFILTRAGQLTDHWAFPDRPGTTARVWETDSGSPRFTVSHEEPLRAVVFSSDGRWLVTTSDDDTAQLWDVASGQRRRTWRSDDDVRAAVFNPAGTQVVTLTERAARVWSVDSDRPLATLEDGEWTAAAAFSPDGSFLVVGGGEAARTWDTATWTRQKLTFPGSMIEFVSFSSDGAQLLTASSGEAQVWTFASAAPMFNAPIAHPSMVFARFSPDNSMVITASAHPQRNSSGVIGFDSAVRYWDAQSGNPLSMRALVFDTLIRRIAFGPGLETLLVNSTRRVGAGRAEVLQEHDTARLWDVTLKDRRRQWVYEGSSDTVAFSPDSHRLLSVDGPLALLFDAATGQRLGTLTHDAAIVTAAFDAGGTVVVTASRDKTARVWDAATGQERFRAKHENDVDAALLVANGRLLATRSGSGMRLWTVGGGRVAEIGAHIAKVEGDRELTRDQFSPDGGLFITRDDKTVVVHDIASKGASRRLQHQGYVRFAAFIDNGRALLTGDETAARVWDVASGNTKFVVESTNRLEAIAVSPDGRTALTVHERTAQLWDTATGLERVTLPALCGSRGAQFVAAGALAVVSTTGGPNDCPRQVVLWDVAAKAVRATINLPGDEQIGFSENGNVMFQVVDTSARQRWQLRIWDTDTGEQRFADLPEGALFQRIAASPDGGRIALSTRDRLSVWAVGGDILKQALEASTTVCLPEEFRRQNLGESAADAARAYEACERRRGRK